MQQLRLMFPMDIYLAIKALRAISSWRGFNAAEVCLRHYWLSFYLFIFQAAVEQ